jgi:magnesium-transporting ATPase (P-type)
VLTGDKMETAINIGYSCKVLVQGMTLLQLGAGSEHEVSGPHLTPWAVVTPCPVASACTAECIGHGMTGGGGPVQAVPCCAEQVRRRARRLLPQAGTRAGQ